MVTGPPRQAQRAKQTGRQAGMQDEPSSFLSGGSQMLGRDGRSSCISKIYPGWQCLCCVGGPIGPTGPQPVWVTPVSVYLWIACAGSAYSVA